MCKTGILARKTDAKLPNKYVTRACERFYGSIFMII